MFTAQSKTKRTGLRYQLLFNFYILWRKQASIGKFHCGSFVLQAFKETIEIFQQKNETFKSASKEVADEVSVSTKVQNSVLKTTLTEVKGMFLNTSFI